MTPYPYRNDRDLIARAIVVRDGHLLVNQNVNKKSGESYVALPGGHVDPGESCVAALAREIEEELAATAQVGELAFVAESIYAGRSRHDKSRHELTLFFEATVTGLREEGLLVSSPEPDKRFCWLPLNQIEAANLLPATARDFLLGQQKARYAFSDTTT